MLCATCGVFGSIFSGSAAAAVQADDGTFRNNYPHADKQSFWAWKWEQVRNGVPEPPPGGWRIPHMRADVFFRGSRHASPHPAVRPGDNRTLRETRRVRHV
jgi:hypothetical protein